MLTSDFEVTAFFLLGGVDKVEELLRPVERRCKGREGASLVSYHSSPSEGFGQPKHIGVDTNHDPTLVRLNSQCLVHHLLD